MESSYPQQLKASIGGPFGEKFEIELQEDRLMYRIQEGQAPLGEHEEVIPSSDDWKVFLATLDRLGVWKWRPEYHAEALEKTDWTLSLEVDGKCMTSRGRNAYPDKEGKPSGFGISSECFESYLIAIRKLLGGRDFY